MASDANQKAVEAAARALLDKSQEPLGSAPAEEDAIAALQAAEPHIRSQLLTELAEEFKRRAAITFTTRSPRRFPEVIWDEAAAKEEA